MYVECSASWFPPAGAERPHPITAISPFQRDLHETASFQARPRHIRPSFDNHPLARAVPSLLAHFLTQRFPRRLLTGIQTLLLIGITLALGGARIAVDLLVEWSVRLRVCLLDSVQSRVAAVASASRVRVSALVSAAHSLLEPAVHFAGLRRQVVLLGVELRVPGVARTRTRSFPSTARHLDLLVMV